MNYGNKFMMNEGILLLSYAYAVNGYSAAAAVFGISSALFAIFWHSTGRFLNNFHRICSSTAVQLPFILASGLSGQIGTIVLLAFCNTIVSILWMESSLRAIRDTMTILMIAFLIFALLAITLPPRLEVFLIGKPMEQISSLLLVLLIFGPLLAAYGMRMQRKLLIRPSGQMMERRNTLGL